jgi:methyl-accepting chemotaxis protein
MWKLQNASIAVKLLLAPLINAVVIVAISALLWISYRTIERSNEFAHVGVELASAAQNAISEFAAGHGALYRAIVLKSQNVEAKVIETEKRQALARMNHAAQLVSAMNVASVNLDPALVADASTYLRPCLEAAQETASLIDIDQFTATMFMTEATRKFSVAEQALDKLATAAVTIQNQRMLESSILLRKVLYQIGAVSIAAISISLAGAFLFGRMISMPLVGMTNIMKRLAIGDLSIDVPAEDRRDEIGAMARALCVFRDNAREAKRLVEQQAGEQLRQVQRAQRLEALAQVFDEKISNVVKGLSCAVEDMEAASTTMSTAAVEANQQGITATATSNQASEHVATVAAAAEQLSSSIQEISRQISKAEAVTTRAVQSAERTNEVISVLSNGVANIGEIVDLIAGVANRTNLLALNATIEAARAGEAGAGFAIVATEVKGLARQIANATKEIAVQIEGLSNPTREAVAAVQETTAVIFDISEISSSVASAVEQQGSATQEIARSVNAAAGGTRDVAATVGRVSTVLAQTGPIVSRLSQAAKGLSAQSSNLHREVGDFLLRVKAT